MKTTKHFFLIILLNLFCTAAFCQSSSGKWVKVVDDGDVTISYNSNITKDKKGNHIVWVKADYHTADWQRYFADMIGSRTLVTSTKTKAHFSPDYNYVMVRQVLCFSKAGKQIYNSGDDTSAGWGVVNASDPVGIVGEYLGNQDSYRETYGY